MKRLWKESNDDIHLENYDETVTVQETPDGRPYVTIKLPAAKMMILG